MSAQITSLLNRGHYRVVGDSGAVLDQDGLFATRKQEVVFRGSEAALITAFKVGNPFTTQGLSFSEAQARMLCTGPESIRLVDYTGSDPHWDVSVGWVGFHKSYQGSANSFYRVDDEFMTAETMFPKEGSVGTLGDGAGHGSYTAIIGPPYAPLVSFAGNPSRARVVTYVPVKKVHGVIFTTTPLSPWHSEIIAIIQKFKASPPLKIHNWLATIPGANSPPVPDPQWNYIPEFTTLAASAGNNSGAGLSGDWAPSNLQINRRLSVEGLYAFTMDVTWEQRVTPG